MNSHHTYSPGLSVMHKRKLISLFAVTVCLVISTSSFAQTACWLESINNRVRKVAITGLPTNGTSAVNVANASVPTYLFLDGRNARFYWSNNGSGSIQRSQVTGGTVTDVVTGITGAGVYVQGIYLDVTNNLLYWSQTAPGALDRIRVINIAGALPKLASAATDVVTGIHIARGITKDTIANTLYYADGGAGGTGKGIYRVSLTSLPVTAVAATKIASTPVALPNTPQPNTLFLDRLNSRIYWSDYANPGGGIFRAATNAGTFPTSVVTVFSGQSVRGISIDLSLNEIYWLQPLTRTIRRASLSNIPVTGVVDVVNNLSDFPRDVVFASANAVLPVTFIYARGYQKAHGIEVEWKLAMEQDISRYIIQRSADGIAFTGLGTVTSRGNSNMPVTYSWFDGLPLSRDNYYRIVAVDKSGSIQHSNVIHINLKKGQAGIAVFPNPVEKDGSVAIELQNLEAGKYNVTVFNKLGQSIFSGIIEHTGGSRMEVLSVANLASGTYSLKVEGKDQQFTKNVLVK